MKTNSKELVDPNDGRQNFPKAENVQIPKEEEKDRRILQVVEEFKTNDNKKAPQDFQERIEKLEEKGRQNDNIQKELQGLKDRMEKLEELEPKLLKEIYRQHNANVAKHDDYKRRFEEVLYTFGNLSQEDFKAEVNSFLVSNSRTNDYFYTLYWWLLTLFQAFRFNAMGLVDIKSDLLTNSNNALLKKLVRTTLKSLEIATSSVHIVGQVISLFNWVFEEILEKHERKRQVDMSEAVFDIFEDVLFDADLQKILIRSVMMICEKLDIETMTRSQKLRHSQRIKFRLGFGGFEKSKILYDIGRSGQKNEKRKLAIYHAIGLVKYLYKHHDKIKVDKRPREDLISDLILHESWIET